MVYVSGLTCLRTNARRLRIDFRRMAMSKIELFNDKMLVNMAIPLIA